jgi:uncharacterized membrane protein SirB2
MTDRNWISATLSSNLLEIYIDFIFLKKKRKRKRKIHICTYTHITNVLNVDL